MDRVRVGLTGLGLVFLLTLAGSVLSHADRKDAAPPAKSGEFLAQLGVVPSTESTNHADPAPPDAPPPDSAPDDEDATGVPVASPPATESAPARMV